MNLAHIASKPLDRPSFSGYLSTKGEDKPLDLESDQPLNQNFAWPLRKPGEDSCEACE